MFQETLKGLVGHFAGARGAAVLNLDGLVIEAVDGGGAPCAAEAATIEYAQVFKQLLGARRLPRGPRPQPARRRRARVGPPHL